MKYTKAQRRTRKFAALAAHRQRKVNRKPQPLSVYRLEVGISGLNHDRGLMTLNAARKCFGAFAEHVPVCWMYISLRDPVTERWHFVKERQNLDWRGEIREPGNAEDWRSARGYYEAWSFILDSLTPVIASHAEP